MVEDKDEYVRGAKGVGKESGRGLMEFFAYKVRKWTQSKDRFPLKTPAGNDKGNLVLFIPSYIRYRMLKNVTHQNIKCARVYVFIFPLYDVSSGYRPKELEFYMVPMSIK